MEVLRSILSRFFSRSRTRNRTQSVSFRSVAPSTIYFVDCVTIAPSDLIMRSRNPNRI
uniref:Uncharacterized protein n=1 Tax=Arundo donax TaxID=35708 RepID=A0A0A9DER7_ARUDO